MVTAVVVTAVALGTTWLPLGVTSEWVWARIPTDFLLAGGVAVAAICGVVFVMFSILGLRRIDHCSATERFGWLLALPVAAFVWQGSLLDSSLPPYGYARTPWVLYYPRSSGYFWQARYEVNDAKEFLETYEELLAERDYLHIGTHPPGLTLGYLGLMQLLRTLPGLTDVVLSTAPESVHEGVEMIRAASVNGAGPLAPADEACLWLASLITQFSAVLTAIIVYLLAARHGNRRSAWLAAVSWTLVPSVLVFLPKSDVLFPFLATLATWLWLTALDRRSIARAIIAGLVLWSGMLLSLAFVTIAALIGVMTSWELFSARRETTAERVRAALWPALGFAAGFLLPLAAVWMWSGLNLLNVWSWNLSNHALFYEHNTRTWWAWLLVNPWELGFGVGLPLALGALFFVAAQLRRGLWRPQSSATVAFALVWGLLWLSGKNMGEAARLWVLLMPWIPLALAEGLGASSVAASDDESPALTTRAATSLVVAQTLVAILTVLRVDGFHFADLLMQ